MTDLQKSPWPGWETVRLIGRGSFGTVYEIRRELVNGTTESAAMKVITIPQNQADISEMYGEGYDDESITATFRAHLKNIVAEYSLMRKLDGSANAVNCKDISYIQHSDGIGWDIFIRMELLTPLTKTLSGTVPEETVLKIGRDICSALVLCKKYDIVHRDIKPQNIFVSPNGDYKLGDFGIAKTVEKTMGGTKVGTYKYMAPEVYNNRPYGSGADLYSLGLVLYWLLNDRRMPFMPLPPAKILAGQDEEARQRRLSGEPLPPPAHGSAELKAIVLKACAYAPEERFHSAREMYKALCRCSRIPVPQEQAPAPAQPASGDAQKPVAASPDAQISDEPTLCGTESEPVEPVMPPKDEKPSRQKKPAADRVRTAVIAAALILACCGIGIFGYLNCWFGHAWQAADCTTPKTCTRCGATEGEALGHSWTEATCTTPKTCTRCGATKGKARGHSWKEATYDAPKTCSVCGLTTGTKLELPIYGLNMTLEEFEKQFASLLEEAKSWTYGTAPQNLDDFPIIPKSLSEMVETIKGAKSDMEVSGSTVTWETNLPELLSASKTGFEWTYMSFDYIDSSQNAWQHPEFDSGKNGKYTIQLPENAWAYGSSPKLFFFGNRYWKGWNEILHVSYEIQNKRVNGVTYVALYMSSNEYSISWCYYFDGSNKLSSDIYSFSSGRIWYLTYDMTSGKLLSMSK